jgi:probable rRNA maturation factor
MAESVTRRESGLEIVVHRGLGARPKRPTLRRLFSAILSQEGLQGGATLSLTLVGEAEIQRLNAQFRGRDSVTDVLSFPLQTENIPVPPGEPPHLGDVVMCYAAAVRQAEEFGHSLDREIAYLFAHGVLHVLGYDHEVPDEQADMRAREERALQAVGLRR